MSVGEMPAGREFDATVAEVVMGWRYQPFVWVVEAGRFIDDERLPYFSTCWEAMRLVVERMRDLGWLSFEMRWVKRGRYSSESLIEGWSVFFNSDFAPFTAGHVEAETAPHAVCLAALKAVQLQREREVQSL